MSTKTTSTDSKQSNKRIRRVWDASMVAHIWAQQEQSDARTPSDNFSFEGPILRSYTTPIARFVENLKGERAVLLSDDHYSMTTNKHQSEARYSTRGQRQVYVDRINRTHSREVNAKDDTLAAIDYRADFASQIKSAIAEAKDAKNVISRVNRHEKIRQLVLRANDLCRFFSLATFDIEAINAEHFPTIEADTGHKQQIDRARAERLPALREARDAKRRAEWAARNEVYRKQNEERERRDAERRANAEPNFQRWLAGDRSVRTEEFNGYRNDPFAYMRLNADGTQVETTRGAIVPSEHVKRFAPIILRFLASGKVYKRDWADSKSIRFGHFTLDEINTDGIVRVGCHTFTRAEIERIGAILECAPAPVETTESGLQVFGPIPENSESAD
jgi:hypothetical protein